MRFDELYFDENLFGWGVSELFPGGIASAEALGTLTIVPGSVTIIPEGIVTAEAFGSAKLVLYLLPTGITSAEAFGNPTVKPIVILHPSGIPSAEAFGNPLLFVILAGGDGLSLPSGGQSPSAL